MIDRMLHPPLDKNKLLLKHNVHTVKEHMAEYKIDSRSVYVILDQICKNADLYQCVKQHKPKRESRGAFYAIHSRWLDLNQVNVTAAEAEAALQMMTYEEKKA